jgi:hypothetical protein
MKQIPADANDVIDLLAAQIGDLSRRNAILQAQLDAAVKLVPADVIDSVKGDADAED